MRKYLLKLMVIFFLAICVFVGIQTFATEEDIFVIDYSHDSSNLLYEANSYTQVDNLEENNNKGSLSSEDEFIVSNNGLSLYLNRTLCIFKVKNEVTNYIYSSALDNVYEGSATTIYASYLSSSFVVEYYKYNKKTEENALLTTQASLLAASKLSDSEKEEYGSVESYPLKLKIDSENRVEYKSIDDGIMVKVYFDDIDISFNAYVTLTIEGLQVRIPDEEIKEENNLLANIVVFPTLGATYNNETQGYMVIPDGSGALIRYGSINTKNATQQSLTFYGRDDGASTYVDTTTVVEPKNLTLPIFGLVNGINQDGVYGIIEEGCYLSQLLISPCGAYNINYNYLTTKYTKRFVYLLYGVNQVILSNRNDENIQVIYRFLENDEANYVGIANDYQKYLVENNDLFQNTDYKYKTRLDYLLSESTTGLIGTKKVTMTTVDDVIDLTNEFKDNGLNNQVIVLNGWNVDAYSGSTPYDIYYNKSVGSTSKYQHLINLNDVKTYFYNDYTVGYKNGNISVRADVAKSVMNLKMTFNNANNNVYNEYYYLYPQSSLNIAKNDLKSYEKLGINSLAIDTTSSTLFTYIKDNKTQSRYNCYQYYDQLMSQLEDKMNISLFNPNVYMYKYLDSYLDMPLYSTGYSFYSDCIPLISYVLRGYIDCYSTYLNFQANSQNQILRLIDFGVYPSYLLTTKASYNLKYTDSYNKYTTAIIDWKNTIIDNDAFLKNGFEGTLEKAIVKREVLVSGVVLLTYDDNTKLVVNYTSNDYSYSLQTIKANSYKVI